jgi:hypothetical protein
MACADMPVITIAAQTLNITRSKPPDLFPIALEYSKLDPTADHSRILARTREENSRVLS